MSIPKDFIYLSTIADLASWQPEHSASHPSNISNTPLLPRAHPPTPPTPAASLPIPNLLICHDYKGGYHPSEASQGQCPYSDPIYTTAHLHLTDTFVYFSHNLVTIPPAPWINTLHRNGVRVLGTFIVEHGSGSATLSRLLDRGSEGEFLFATQLARIASTYGFDGWLMNLESPFPAGSMQPSVLQAFLRELRSGLVEFIGQGGQVLWYDALTVTNQVRYQNGLTLLNAPFFHVADGLFTNYWWRQAQLEATRAMADTMGRVADVYSGIDCYGRGSFGGGGFGVGSALAAISKVGTSVALFAPGWTFENFGGVDFEIVDRKFWVGDGGKIDEDSPVKPVSYFVSGRPSGSLDSLYTNFNRGFGKALWVDGIKVLDKPWVHIGAQSVLPSKNPFYTDRLKWSFSDETAFFGGTSLSISAVGAATRGEVVYCPLYDTWITADKTTINVVYSLPEPRGGEVAGEAVGVYYSSTASPTKTLLPLPLTHEDWGRVSLAPISASEDDRITELGIYYKHHQPITRTGTGTAQVLTLGSLRLHPFAETPQQPSVVGSLAPSTEADGSTKLSWKVYKSDFSPLAEEIRGIRGRYSSVTGDFASFLLWYRGEFVGVSYCLEYTVRGVGGGSTGGGGDWRVDGVTWDGQVVRG